MQFLLTWDVLLLNKCMCILYLYLYGRSKATEIMLVGFCELLWALIYFRSNESIIYQTMDAAWLLPDPDLETTTVENTTVTNANETDLIITPDSSAETAPDWTAASTNAPTKWSNDSKIHC